MRRDSPASEFHEFSGSSAWFARSRLLDVIDEHSECDADRDSQRKRECQNNLIESLREINENDRNLEAEAVNGTITRMSRALE
jgi:hypothetical protein